MDTETRDLLREAVEVLRRPSAHSAARVLIERITQRLDAEASEAPERVRHVKRGTEYEVLHRGAELQIARARRVQHFAGWQEDRSLTEGHKLVIYQGSDGKIWAREESEFDDGRFVPVSATPGAVTVIPVRDTGFAPGGIVTPRIITGTRTVTIERCEPRPRTTETVPERMIQHPRIIESQAHEAYAIRVRELLVVDHGWGAEALGQAWVPGAIVTLDGCEVGVEDAARTIARMDEPLSALLQGMGVARN